MVGGSGEEALSGVEPGGEISRPSPPPPSPPLPSSPPQPLGSAEEAAVRGEEASGGEPSGGDDEPIADDQAMGDLARGGDQSRDSDPLRGDDPDDRSPGDDQPSGGEHAASDHQPSAGQPSDDRPKEDAPTRADDPSDANEPSGAVDQSRADDPSGFADRADDPSSGKSETAANAPASAVVAERPSKPAKPGYRIKRKATPLPTPLAPESHVEGDNSTPRSQARSPEREASDAKAETAGADGGGEGGEDGGEGESEQQAIKRRKAKARPPEGWLESSAGGEAIRGICPIKTPLSSNFNMPHPSDAWEVKECIAACGGERVKLLIDLTASSRYYSPEEVPPHVSYRKLPVAGHGLPSQGEVESALGWIKELQGDEIAVVHCTHGLNRTGYIVVRALVELHSFPLLQALENFAKLRPPGLWRHEYLNDLHDRYGGPPPQPPAPPAWEKQPFSHGAHISARGAGRGRGGGGDRVGYGYGLQPLRGMEEGAGKGGGSDYMEVGRQSDQWGKGERAYFDGGKHGCSHEGRWGMDGSAWSGKGWIGKGEGAKGFFGKGGRGGKGGRECFNCGQFGHMARDCPAVGKGKGTGRSEMAAPLPVSIQEAMPHLNAADQAVVGAFFSQTVGKHVGKHDILLEREPCAEISADGRALEFHVLLKLDFASWSWQRVRRRALR